jgi:EAL domain-containing protein (putative c-di-GMP-specific phosphodiesterase class I)
LSSEAFGWQVRASNDRRRQAGGPILCLISLNATEAELSQPDFAGRLLKKLDDCAIDPSTLELEVTEALFLGTDTSGILTELKRLSAAGILIALDDIGTGSSSLSHLHDFPIDQIKFDKSFVSGLGQSSDGPAIIKALLDLAHSLSMTVVAEGIETETQYWFLRANGCESGQGYLFGKARPVACVTGRRWAGVNSGIDAIGSSAAIVSCDVCVRAINGQLATCEPFRAMQQLRESRGSAFVPRASDSRKACRARAYRYHHRRDRAWASPGGDLVI